MARVWGRVAMLNGDGSFTRQWQAVETAANGDNSAVMVTVLCQVLLLNLGEDPFFADWGVPQYASVMTQIFPDFYVYQTQSRFTQYFLSLSVQKVHSPTPTYNIGLVTKAGAPIEVSFPI